MSYPFEIFKRGIPVLAACAGVCLTAGAAAFDERVLFLDEYESASARPGNPEIVTGIVSPGLLTQTRTGLYRGARVPVAEKLGPWEVPVAGKVTLAYGFRLYGFGETRRAGGTLLTTFADGTEATNFTVTAAAGATNITARFGSAALVVPYAALPADFTAVFDSSGNVTVEVESLSESRRYAANGKAAFFKPRARRVTVSTALVGEGCAPAEARLDRLAAVLRAPAEKFGAIPAKIAPLPEFDPVRAGWKCVFSDAFSGTSLDTNKWETRTLSGLRHVKVKDGFLAIGVDRKPGSDELETGSIWTRESFGYGYFEARLRFTKENGWWAAFWLYGDMNGNPFVDGFEIDIFEDYYTRQRDADGTPRNIIDHNLHMHCNATLKSWNYMERLQGSIDDFHVIGCKRTPFEITYYLDGRAIRSSAMHSPWNTVTFDPFNHGAGTVPLRAILSGQIMQKDASWLRGTTEFVRPEEYLVDWIRIYEYPDAPEQRPAIAWAEDYPSDAFHLEKEGARLARRVAVKPASGTGRPVKAVYLFDSGYLLAYRTEPPYDFTVDCTEKFFAGTDYMRPGRQKLKPGILGLHALVAFAEDADGRVSSTPPLKFQIVSDRVRSTPFEGKAAAIPGVIDPARYDAGGPNVAYSDGSKGNIHGVREKWRLDEDVDCHPGVVGGVGRGEWLNFTVDVAREGDYAVSFKYGTPSKTRQEMLFLCDLKPIGRVKMTGQDVSLGWSFRNTAEATLHLPAGRHVLRIVLEGDYNFGNLTFKPADPRM